MPIIDLAGDRFHVVLDGPEDAPALLVSNSLSANLTMWDDQIPLWSGSFRVIRYDQRGHGLSAAPDRPYSMAELGRDALGILDHLGIERAHWCGLSLGGMVGMWLLTNAPDRIARAVLSNTSAYAGDPALWDGRIRTAQRRGMEVIVEPTIERWFTKDFIARQPATVDRVRGMIRSTAVAGYAGCAAAIRDMDQRETIRSIGSPTLVIVGAHDPSTTPAAGQLIQEAIPGSRLVALDAAHLSNVEQAAAFSQTVLDFLT